MNSAAGTATGYTHAIDSPAGLPLRRVRAQVFAKSDPELLAIYDHADAGDDADLRRAERDFLMRRCGLPANRIIMLQQVHGDRALAIHAQAAAEDTGAGLGFGFSGDAIYFGEGDALYTKDSGVLLVIRTADCLPLFFELSLRGKQSTETIAGIVHAGWRGMAAGIISQTLSTALAELRETAQAREGGGENNDDGQDAGEFRGRFFIGPCIGAESYEVGADVADHFTQKRPLPENGKYLLDLPANARLEIDRALANHARDFGLDATELAASCEFLNEGSQTPACTYQSNDLYFSHRRGDRGRNLNTILIEE